MSQAEIDAFALILSDAGYHVMDCDTGSERTWYVNDDNSTSISVWPDGRWDFGYEQSDVEGHGPDTLAAFLATLD